VTSLASKSRHLLQAACESALRTHRQASSVLQGVAASFLVVLSAQAQDVEGAGSGGAEADEIMVTGSRIRGVAPVGAPTIALGRSDLTATTASTVADFLKEVPQITSTGIDETSFTTVGVSASNVSRASAINLRGLTPVATLVLVDGHRVTPSGTAGAFVDPSSIPTIALERVEVVADGASAIYGSDAIAGVVNLILRKNFVGAETSVRINSADSYQRTQVSQLLGTNWGSGNLMFAYEYMKNDSLSSLERDFYRQDQRARGGDDFRVSTCNPGNIILDGVSYAIPASNDPVLDPASLVPGTRNLCDTSANDIIPKQERHSAVFYLSQDITSGFRLFADGFYTRKRFEPRFISQGSATNLVVLTVPSSNAFFVAPAGTSPASVNVEYSFFDEFGFLSADGTSETYSVNIGGEFDLPSDWRLSVAGQWGQNRDYTFSRSIYRPALDAALASSDPSTALNPFGPGTNPDVIEGIFVGQFSPGGRNTMGGGEVRADGRVFDLPGGAVRLAVGGEFRRYSLATDTTRGTIDNPATDYGFNEREVISGYAEMFVPIVGAANARAGIQRLDLSLAVRYDEYNDFGSTSNPKIGLTWQPLDSLIVRGSYGTSFRAPSLSDLRAPGESNVATSAVDPRSPTGQSRGITIRGGNPNLGPEEATTYTLGMEWRPAALPDLSVDLTYFSIDYDKQIGSAWGAPVLQEEEIYQDVIIRNPTPEQVQAVLNNGRPLSGVLPPTIDYIIDGTTRNRGATHARGFDFVLGYDWHTSSYGTFTARTSGTYYTRYDTQLTPTAPVLRRVGTINYPLRFRARTDLRWSLANLSAGLTVNYSHGYWDTSEDPWDRVDSLTTVDASLSYVFDGTSRLAGLTASLNVSNVFDEDPPFINTAAGYDPGKASPYGRLFTLALTKSW